VPVIAVAEGGMRETIQDGVNGVIVEHDPEKMAAAIERLMADDELAQRLSRDAYCLVREKWALPTSIDRLESRLRSTLAKAQERIAEPSMDRAKNLPGGCSPTRDDAV
jgi:glycosyltransferase involved in cell wall biosynthesis